MFYISAGVAIVGAVSYQYFVKRVPTSLNPIVSIIGMYVAVLVLGVILLPFFPPESGLRHEVRKLSWIQVALAFSVIMIELGFLLMYRYGWSLGTGNLVTGVFVNLILVGLGLALLGEKMSAVNTIGIALCILGIALISYHLQHHLAGVLGFLAVIIVFNYLVGGGVDLPGWLSIRLYNWILPWVTKRYKPLLGGASYSQVY